MKVFHLCLHGFHALSAYGDGREITKLPYTVLLLYGLNGPLTMTKPERCKRYALQGETTETCSDSLQLRPFSKWELF